MGILVLVSSKTRIDVNYNPTGQTLDTLTANTAVTFDNTTGKPLPTKGTYKVQSHHLTIEAKQESTGQVQKLRMLVREPVGAGNNRPGVVFMHGAGYGTCDNSFGDMAQDMSSAGFVTAVIDKPIWSTTDVTRDYPASATAYDQAINIVRKMSNVDANNVGIYATSESTWVSSYLIDQDPDIAFQILLSPMVFTPRLAVAFLATQDFTLVGANDGYQMVLRRVLSTDMPMLGLTNADINTLVPKTYSIPTFVAYGSKDVMTAQVQGVKKILALAHEADNWNVTVRSYPVANHVLRLGDEAQANTPFADDYVRDTVSWAVGTALGLRETSDRIAGTPLYQSISVPFEMHSRRGVTIYGGIVLISMVLMLLAATILGFVAFGKYCKHKIRHDNGAALGFCNGFGKSLMMLTIITVASILLFLGGFGEVVMAVVRLAWGQAPDPNAGMKYWSWPVIKLACVVVVWAWSRVFMRVIEVASERGLVQWPLRRGAIREIMSGKEPIIATTRLGRAVFWVTTIAMLLVLLSFAFWGLFLY